MEEKCCQHEGIEATKKCYKCQSPLCDYCADYFPDFGVSDYLPIIFTGHVCKKCRKKQITIACLISVLIPTVIALILGIILTLFKAGNFAECFCIGWIICSIPRTWSFLSKKLGSADGIVRIIIYLVISVLVGAFLVIPYAIYSAYKQLDKAHTEHEAKKDAEIEETEE